MMQLPWHMSDLHPHALSLDKDALRDGFGAALRADLATMTPPDIIHRYRCVLPLGAQTQTLKTAGFHAVRQTWLIDVPFTLSTHAALSSPLPNHIAPHWFKPGERGPWDQWITAHWRHYRALHRSNPPREPADGLAAVFVGADLTDALALRDGPQGRVRAFASLRTNAANGERTGNGDIGWIGGIPDLIPHALSACLRRAAALGWTTASFEVDDEDAILWALATDLGLVPAQTFVTWQHERDPAKRPN